MSSRLITGAGCLLLLVGVVVFLAFLYGGVFLFDSPTAGNTPYVIIAAGWVLAALFVIGGILAFVRSRSSSGMGRAALVLLGLGVLDIVVLVVALANYG